MRALGITGFVVSAFLAGVFLPSPLHAQATCDPDFMDVMEARAWMEGAREMETAQKLILKPDSVLEYSCFNTRITEVGTAFGNNIPGLRPGTRNAMLREPLVAHLQNFSHTLGGGLAPGAPIGATCNAMYAIWDLLKCDNFNKADFRTFADFNQADGLNTHDPRTLPAPCSGDPAARTNMWNIAIAAAFPVPAMPAASGGMDDTNTFLLFLNPAGCNTINPIPTGVPVAYWTDDDPPEIDYDADAVCLAPGCYYDPVDNDCNSTP